MPVTKKAQPEVDIIEELEDLEEDLELDDDDLNELDEEDLDEDLDDEDEDEDLQEFKASFGDPSEIPEPITKKVKKRRGDKDGKLDAHVPPNSPKTKVGVVKAVVEKMMAMDTSDLVNQYNEMLGIEEEVDEEGNVIENDSVRLEAGDIDVTKDIEAIFNGKELDEEFKNQAKTVFEAAVISKVNEIIGDLSENAEAEIEANRVAIVEQLSTQVNDYLDYVINEWVEENRIAIEKGIRAEMVESFMGGLKELFVEHYVDVPEEQVDVVEEFADKVEELEIKLNEQIEANIKLSSKVKEFEKEMAFEEVAEDLNGVQTEKLRSLAEGVEFKSATDYAEKIEMIKKKYFNEDASDSVVLDDDDDPISLEEETDGTKVLTPAMATYLKSISRSVKK